jgi:hypothetical protein
MVQALNLGQRDGRTRQDEDGHLDVNWKGKTRHLLFECKSTVENADYGTGRDTGLRQLARWGTMHFVFGVFEPRDNVPKRMWYGSPRQMSQWNAAERDYLKPDLMLLQLIPSLVGEAELFNVLGKKDAYTYEDLRRLMKDQWHASAAQNRKNLYQERADVHRSKKASENRYSRKVAIQAVRERVDYLLSRGGTVNNRKISAAYVHRNGTELKAPWAASLIQAVKAELRR